jgi:hypothetical protein
MVLQLCGVYPPRALFPNGVPNPFPFELLDCSPNALSRITTTDDARIASIWRNSRGCPGSFNGSLPASLPYRVILGCDPALSFIDDGLPDFVSEDLGEEEGPSLPKKPLITTRLSEVTLSYEATPMTAGTEIDDTLMELMQLVAENDGSQVLILFASEVMEHKWDVICKLAEVDLSERPKRSEEEELAAGISGGSDKLKSRMLSIYFIRSWTQNIVAIAR